MKTNKLPVFFDIALLQSILLYIILAIFLFPHYLYQLNPDGISYMSIAQKYMLHDFSNAINGYWGPLISWLMVPFLYAGFKPVAGANLLILIIGLTVVIQSNSLIKILNINLLLRYAVLNLITIIVIFFAFHAITPDLLFVSFSLAFVNKILNSSFRNSKYTGVITGLIGSGLYFTKNFGFPFFITSFFIVSLMFYLRTGDLNIRRRIVSNYISGMIVFLLISGCWVLLISHKYGQLLIGIAGIYNRALTEPNSLGAPMFYAGLFDPPNNTAISIWEDVSRLKIVSWNIFDSFNSVIYEMRIICKNLLGILSILNEFSLFSIPVLLIALDYLMKTGRQFIVDNIFYLVLILAILFSGYAMIWIDPRFFWFSIIVIIIIGAKLLNLLFDIILIRKVYKVILTGIFVIGFLVFPVKSVYRSLNNGKSLFELSNRIKNLNINGRMASIGDWEMSFYISFYNNWQYYGQSGNKEESYLENELKNKKIDYYFVWESYENKLKFLEKYQEITGGTINGLRIYKVK